MKRIQRYIKAVNWKNTLIATLLELNGLFLALIFYPNQSIKALLIFAFFWWFTVGNVMLEIWNETK